MARFCSECGHELQHEIEETAQHEAVVAEVTSAEVEIARINAKRDVDLAKIQAGMFRDEMVVEAAVAVAEAEVLEDVLDAQQPEPEPQLGSEPVVIVDQAPVVEEDMTSELPEPEHHEHQADEPKEKKSSGYGNSAWFS